MCLKISFFFILLSFRIIFEITKTSVLIKIDNTQQAFHSLSSSCFLLLSHFHSVSVFRKKQLCRSGVSFSNHILKISYYRDLLWTDAINYLVSMSKILTCQGKFARCMAANRTRKLFPHSLCLSFYFVSVPVTRGNVLFSILSSFVRSKI